MRKRLYKLTLALLSKFNSPALDEGKVKAVPKAPSRVVGNDLHSLSLPIPVFPATEPQDLLNEHKEQVTKIRNVLGLSIDETQKYLDPVLLRYVETVHLLPASEIHHHRAIGGLLRHGLEVAFWAGQCSLAYSFDYQGKLSDKRQHILRWRLAFILAGLLHDLGKPVADMVVTDGSGEHVWSPFNESVWGWSKRLNISGYYVFWRKNRVHKQHEISGFHAANRVIGDDTLTFISQYDQELLPALFGLLSGHPDRSSLLYQAVSKADSHSTKKDLEKNGVPINTYIQGTPLDLRLVEVMRELSKKTWTTNKENSIIWHLPSGLYLHWEKAVADINRTVSSMNFVGIPKDSGVLADTLIDSGIAKAYVVPSLDTGEEKQYRYHPLLVKNKEAKKEKTDLDNSDNVKEDNYIYGLLITDFSYVFNGPCPAPLTDQSVIAIHQVNIKEDHHATEKTESKQKNELQPKNDQVDESAEKEPSVQEKPLVLEELVEKLLELEGIPPSLEENPELEINDHTEEVDSEQFSESKTEIEVLPETSKAAVALALPTTSHVAVEPPSKVTRKKKKSKRLMLPTSVNNSNGGANSKKPKKPKKSRKPTNTGVTLSDQQAVSATSQVTTEVGSSVEQRTSEKPMAVSAIINDYKAKLEQQTIPPVTEWLMSLTVPTLKQEVFLGAQLLRINQRLYIRYPEGIKALGEMEEVTTLLAKNKTIVADQNNQYVHNIDGRSVLQLHEALSTLISTALEKIAIAVDPVAQGELIDVEEKPPLDAVSDSFESNDPTVEPMPPLPAEFLAQNSVVHSDFENPFDTEPEAEPSATDDVQPVHIDDEDEEKTEITEAEEVETIEKAPFDLSNALDEFIEMMKVGHGRWIQGEVTRNGNELSTNDYFLKAVLNEFPKQTTRKSIKSQIFFTHTTTNLRLDNDTFILTLEDKKQDT